MKENTSLPLIKNERNKGRDIYAAFVGVFFPKRSRAVLNRIIVLSLCSLPRYTITKL